MIEFVNVGKQYKRSAEYVLEYIDLRIKEGEFLVLLGASGSGKLPS